MIVEGINVIRELLNSNAQIEKILAEEKSTGEINNLTQLANKKGIAVERLDKQKLEKIAGGKNQGIIAFVPNFRYSEVEDIIDFATSKQEKPFIVILDGIEDPHNMGAIIRTAECAGVHGIIIPQNRSVDVNGTVFKTSAGAISHIKVAKVVNLVRTINELKKLGIWIYALEAGNKTIYQADFTYPTALVVGSEGKGVSRLVKETVDEVLSLDMFGSVNSLNASNAAAIGMYEVVRQRRS